MKAISWLEFGISLLINLLNFKVVWYIWTNNPEKLDKSVIELISNIGNYSTLLPIGFFFIFKKNYKKRSLLVIFLYCILSYLTDTLLALNVVKKNAPIEYLLLTIFTVVELTLFSTFIYLSLGKKKFRLIILILNVTFVFFTFIFYLLGFVNDTIFASIECIIIIVCCMLYFYEQLINPTGYFIYTSPNFWIIVGCFIYLSGTLFLFIYSTSLSRNDRMEYWFINGIFLLIKNIFFTIAFFIKPEKISNTPMRKPFGIL